MESVALPPWGVALAVAAAAPFLARVLENTWTGQKRKLTDDLLAQARASRTTHAERASTSHERTNERTIVARDEDLPRAESKSWHD
jgi:hypothetical protein